MLCCVTVRSVWRVDRLAVAFRIASLSGALFSCFFCDQQNKQQLIKYMHVKKNRTSSQNLDRGLTLSSELTSAVFGGVGGGLFFMSSKTSTTYIKHVSFMENCANRGKLERRYIPLSLRFSSATVFVSERTLSVAAWISLWCVRVLGSSRLPCTHYKLSTKQNNSGTTR